MINVYDSAHFDLSSELGFECYFQLHNLHVLYMVSAASFSENTTKKCGTRPVFANTPGVMKNYPGYSQDLELFAVDNDNSAYCPVT
jgi:hypothetical protein